MIKRNRQEGDSMTETVVFNTIMANGMETNAGIFVGQNTAPHWTTHNKTQGAASTVIGFYNTLPHNINILHDNDVIDTPIHDTDYRGPSATSQL
jgi:hypothetical protein